MSCASSGLALPVNTAIVGLSTGHSPFGRNRAPSSRVRSLNWLGWKDSNLRMAGSKPAALPLGDTPLRTRQRPCRRIGPARAGCSRPAASGRGRGPRNPSSAPAAPRAPPARHPRRRIAANTQLPVPVSRAGRDPPEPVERLGAPAGARRRTTGSQSLRPPACQETANCDGGGIPCQFRGLKHLRRADGRRPGRTTAKPGSGRSRGVSRSPTPSRPGRTARGRTPARRRPGRSPSSASASGARPRPQSSLSATSVVAASELPPPSPPCSGIRLRISMSRTPPHPGCRAASSRAARTARSCLRRHARAARRAARRRRPRSARRTAARRTGRRTGRRSAAGGSRPAVGPTTCRNRLSLAGAGHGSGPPSRPPGAFTADVAPAAGSTRPRSPSPSRSHAWP